jgi:hypothetical protein
MAKLVEELHCGQWEKMATFSAKSTAGIRPRDRALSAVD